MYVVHSYSDKVKEIVISEARPADGAAVPGVSTTGPDDAAVAPLPRGVEILWRTAAPPRRGPRPGLTLDAIAEAAIRVADAEGLGGVSMARVAAGLEVTTMALYRYVGSKDELLSIMLDVAMGPPPDDAGTEEHWRRRLERWAGDQLALLERHPWIMQGAGMSGLGPNRVAWIEAGLQALSGTPLSHELRTAVIGTVSLHVLSEGRLLAAVAEQSRAAQVLADGPTTPRTGEDGAQGHPALLDYPGLLRRLTAPESHPAISAALEAGGFDDHDEPPESSFGLRMMLDGVEALVARVEPGGQR